ncbi:MAG TPA: DUF2147 domain-containing protein [Spirosoma sp.]|jgi:uncharacterized protein (DUF2147 family)|nr:DUF2147 domain-containing protein [Spirosoma sp.]
MTRLPFFCLLIVFILTGSALTARPDDPDQLVGRWCSSKKKNHVQIYRQGDRYYGKLVWMAEPTDPHTNRPKVDKLNPNDKLRMRPVLNLPIITNLVYKGNNVWTDGQIYNPEDGKTYGCELTLRDANTLSLHGFMLGMSFLGRTTTWTRLP